MLKYYVRTIIASGLTAALFAGTAVAQSAEEPSAADLQKLFQKHRGLVLAPTTPTEDADTTATQTTATTVVEAPATPEIAAIPKDIQVNVNIRFDFDSAILRDNQKPLLVNLCTVMANDTGRFRIVGHTDSSGSDSYNEHLSRLRAQEVKRYLVSDCGIAPTRLEAVGVGERFPFNEQDTRSDENRRVEFQAVS